MNNFDLATYGVAEMNETEIMEIEGGGIGTAIAIAAILLLACAAAAY